MSYTLHSNIKAWAEDDRPREKMLLKGHSSLSDAELIAILIGSGTQNLSAVDLAKQILSLAHNNLAQLGKLSIKDLTKIKGIGEAKAITLSAALELGRRRQSSDALQVRKIGSSSQAYELLSPYMCDLQHEEFWAIFLNKRNVVLKYKKITQGGWNSTIVDQKQVFQMALQEGATSIVLAHNHPSGTLHPSHADIQITQTLVKAGRILDIPVSDHIIITQSGFYSMADNGNM